MGAALPATNVSGAVANVVGADKNLCRQKYDDGSEYFGQFRKKKFHGKGKMMWKLEDGKSDEYDGVWVDGMMHGQGVYKYFDGTRYQGQFRENIRQGYGILTFNDGSLYEGEWSADVPQGAGRVIYSNGKIVNTTFVDGQQSMQRLESMVAAPMAPKAAESLDFVPVADAHTAPRERLAINPAERDLPSLPPPPPPFEVRHSALAQQPDVSLPIADSDGGFRLPVLPPPPPLDTRPLPALALQPHNSTLSSHGA